MCSCAAVLLTNQGLTDSCILSPASTAAAGSDKPPVVRSLDYDEASSSILVGTLDSCIWEVSANSSTQQQQQHILVPGHSHDVWAVACHSEQPHIISSVCDGNKVYVWDLKARQLLRAASVGFVCRAVTFSAVAYGAPGAAAAGHHIAVGGAQGHIRVRHELRWLDAAVP